MTHASPMADLPHVPRRFLRFVLGLIVCLGAGQSRSWAQSWSLTTVDFKSERVALNSISPDAVVVSTEASPNRRIPMGQFLLIERVDSSSPAPGKFIAMLGGNDVAVGEPRAIKGDNLIWENPILGELSLPIKSVQGISAATLGEPVVDSAARRTEDVVVMSNGDTMRGIIADIDATSVSIQPTGSPPTRVPLENVRRITFAQIGSAAPEARQRGFNIHLSDRTTLTATAATLDRDSVSITLPGGAARKLPIAAVHSIEQINGPVVWLSSLTPSESISKPFLELAWPPRMDRAVDGEPIRIGEEVFARGIGVHAYSQLSFPIDPGVKAFRTRYAIAGDWPYANVTVRIKLDDKIVHEKTDVRSGSPSAPVIIPIQGEKKLTLEVDYGQNYDVQDRLNWIEPAFLNFPPVIPPTAP